MPPDYAAPGGLLPVADCTAVVADGTELEFAALDAVVGGTVVAGIDIDRPAGSVDCGAWELWAFCRAFMAAATATKSEISFPSWIAVGTVAFFAAEGSCASVTLQQVS